MRNLLTGCWRAGSLPQLDFSAAELEDVAPLLSNSGVTALAWRRIKDTTLHDTTAAQTLHDSYRLLALRAAIHEENLTSVLTALHESGIDPLLVKGWHAANLYPERGLRPYGDIDLCVQRDDYDLAASILSNATPSGCVVDLHLGFSELADRTVSELYRRSTEISIADRKVRVLCDEDHLALLAIHMLKHGGWRPLALCDIGAAIESTKEGFDWELCLGHEKRRQSWIISAIGLAHELVGASIDRIPFADRVVQFPRWLAHSVLKQWENPYSGGQAPMNHPIAMRNQLAHPIGLLRAVRQRWPNPVLATMSLNQPFNNLPRLPYQLGNWGLRLARLVTGDRVGNNDVS